MKIKFLCLCILTGFSSISAHALANLGTEPLSGDAVDILSQAISNDIVYMDANLWKEENNSIHQLNASQLQKTVINEGKKLLIDFSLIKDQKVKSERKSVLQKIIGLSFPEDFLAITAYKRKLMFSPFAGKDDSNLAALLAAPDQEPQVAAQTFGPRSRSARSGGSTKAPNVAFYLSANYRIPDADCTFENALTDYPYWFKKGSRNFCELPSISLIYQVTLARSLPFGSSGASTPDAKIVRISLDDTATGTGISLNQRLNTNYYTVADGGGWWGGGLWIRGYSTSAIAQEYAFTFDTNNDKPQILRTLPRSNLNAKYNHTESSGFQYGISANVEGDQAGPKGSLSVSATWSQNKSFTYDTSDYLVKRTSSGATNVSFAWIRDQYASAESLLKSSRDREAPVDFSKIKSVSYSGFVPKMDVVYKASPETKGSTEFKVTSSVVIRPIYHQAMRDNGYKWKGYENSPRKRINQISTFTVDWENPVFLGGRPVNLQLATFNNKCVSVNSKGAVSAEGCSVDSVPQSFIYDQYQRYVSINNAEMCLDGENLTTLQTCKLRLSQRWDWEGDNLKSKNESSSGQPQYLGYHRQTGALTMVSKAETAEQAKRLVTTYTNVFKN